MQAAAPPLNDPAAQEISKRFPEPHFQTSHGLFKTLVSSLVLPLVYFNKVL